MDIKLFKRKDKVLVTDNRDRVEEDDARFQNDEESRIEFAQLGLMSRMGWNKSNFQLG
jgi:hypothetical protein